MVPFDPYLNWLGIPPHEQPPNFYRLLGVVLFESNPEVIEQAADRQSLRVGAYQAGPQGEICQQLLSEIAMAQFCLLDPQQKAAYDGQLQESLAQRGERAVAPPPPAWSGGGQQLSSPSPQFGPQPPQFGPQGGIGPMNPGQGMPGPVPAPMQAPMTMPGPPPMLAPMPGVTAMSGQGAMPGPPAMPGPLQPMMPMPPTMTSGPTGFAPVMPRPSAPAAMPVAAPFPTATAVAAGPPALPTQPPAAPQRPIDELENLTSQPTTRRRIPKKKKVDYTKEIIIASVVTVVGIFLFIAWAVTASQDHTPRGFEEATKSVPEKPVDARAKLAEERKQKEKEIAKEKAKAKEEKEKKAAAAHPSGGSGTIGPLRPFGADVRRPNTHSQASDDGDAPLPTPHSFGPPTRTMDSPDATTDVVPAAVGQAPQPNGHDITPDGLGSDNDPVMGPVGTEKPVKP